MRLLNVNSFEISVFNDEDTTPPYITASHRWFHQDDEINLEDIVQGHNTGREGYLKVQGFAQFVRERLPNVQWLWVDTCCIDKSNNTELSEAIISMFRWYRRSELCLAYLHDVDANTSVGPNSLRRSEWFKRGWTLQELLAPRTVIFLARDWQVIGHKGVDISGRSGSDFISGPSLEQTIHEITDIPTRVLRDYGQSRSLSVDQKFKWTIGRQTTRKEDLSYCLFGIFDVCIPVLYGERQAGAERRLRAAIESQRTPNSANHLGQHQQAPYSGSPKLKCSKCPRIFNNRSEVDQHRRDSHGSVFPFDCRSCKCKFKSIDARNQHMRDSHS